MENVPCEVFMNEVEIETNLIEEENIYFRKTRFCEQKLPKQP
jgi:hypothetical protein